MLFREAEWKLGLKVKEFSQIRKEIDVDPKGNTTEIRASASKVMIQFMITVSWTPSERVYATENLEPNHSS